MTVSWRARAVNDVLRITRHVAADNPVAAARLGQELFLAGESLAVFPFRGRPGRLSGTRELLMVTPYILVYRIIERDIVRILRIWHAAQDRPDQL